MKDLQVVPLHYVDPLPDAGIDARLIWEVMERSMVRLNHNKAGSSAIVFPLGKCPHYA